MEAVGSIKTHEIRAAEAVLSERRESLHRQEEANASRSRDVSDGKSTAESSGSDDSQKRIERIADAMDSFVKSIQRDLDIQFDKGTGRTVVRVLSRETGEVIREIPPKELLELASRMEEMAGVLLNKSA
jgi:flagellar protein FlaG